MSHSLKIVFLIYTSICIITTQNGLTSSIQLDEKTKLRIPSFHRTTSSEFNPKDNPDKDIFLNAKIRNSKNTPSSPNEMIGIDILQDQFVF